MKVYVNHLKGVQVTATISLQCNSLSQVYSSVYFRLIIVCHKTHNGWYLVMVAPISSILGLLILYSKNVVGR